MKTTIELPDQLAREAKLFAAERRTTLRALVLQGLEHVIKEKQVSAKSRAKNLFAAMGTPHDSKCPHGAPFYSCMSCSH
jgi:hypothetical protein